MTGGHVSEQAVRVLELVFLAEAAGSLPTEVDLAYELAGVGVSAEEAERVYHELRAAITEAYKARLLATVGSPRPTQLLRYRLNPAHRAEVVAHFGFHVAAPTSRAPRSRQSALSS